MGDFGKLIIAKGLKNLPKVQLIAQSGHTVGDPGKYLLSNADTVYLCFLNGPSLAFSFIFVLFKQSIKTVDFSGIRTRIVGGKGEHAAHLTTTTKITMCHWQWRDSWLVLPSCLYLYPSQLTADHCTEGCGSKHRIFCPRALSSLSEPTMRQAVMRSHARKIA